MTNSNIVFQGPRNVTIETDLPELNLTTQSSVMVFVKMVEVGNESHNKILILPNLNILAQFGTITIANKQKQLI